MFVTFIVRKGAADPDVSTLWGSMSAPAEFPSMTDAVYNRDSVNLGVDGRLYCVGLPVTADPVDALESGEKVYLGITRLADVVVTVPLHTCIGYDWFLAQNPTDVQEVTTDGGIAYWGTITGGRILLAPVVMI